MPATVRESENPPRAPEPDGGRLRPNRLRNLAAVSLAAFVIGFVGFFTYAAYLGSQFETPGHSVRNDLSVFWAAARIALESSPIDAFDVERLNQARNLPASVSPAARQMAWSYPPQFHALILPLGLMPFLVAWVVFGVVSTVAFWIGLRRLVPGRSIAIIAAASPAALMCVFNGQSSLLVAALLAGFLACLRDRRDVSAGVLLAGLTIKPQFGPLLPLVLIVGGNWRVIGWAVAASLVIVLLTLAWAGPGYWGAFFDGLGDVARWVETGWLPRHLMINWYAFGIGAGLSHSWASYLQVGVTAALVAAVIWAWQAEVPFPLKAAMLTIAIPLASPYAYYYDLVLPMIGVALMLSVLRPGDYFGAAMLAALWALPTLGLFGRELGVYDAFALISAPVLTMSLALLLWRIALARRQAGA